MSSSALLSRRASDRLSGRLRILLLAAFVSDTGGGLTFPFLLIYLHEARHIGLSTAGLLIGAVFVVGLPAGPVAGALVDRVGPRPVALTCLSVQAIGTAALTLVHSPVSAIVPVAILGLGQGASWPAWFAILGAAAGEDTPRPRLFARSFQLLNLGLGVGSVIGGLVVRVSAPGT
ncbi:MAG TPA: MFS transporter, partial [Acidimicrobiales bacterium]|nr:MFS transporter [Acidimicrobiales bacterium]